MKKINKYFRNASSFSLSEELSRYKKMAASIQKDAASTKARKTSPLALIIPFAAASLTPFGMNAQCNGTATPQPDFDFLIDMDGDGTNDFEIASQGNDLFVYLLNATAEVASTPSGNYDYPINFASGASVCSANPNWQDVSEFRNHFSEGVPYGTMEFGGTAGNWAPTATGFLGVRLNGNQLGFIEVNWSGSGAATIGMIGIQTPDNASETCIVAGDCLSLPVELVELEGEMFDTHSELTWSTASEENNKGFEIQRSKNGNIFRTVGFVEGQGNSNTNIDYVFNDKEIRKGTDYYYRLRQIDFWGSRTESDVIHLKAASPAATRLIVSPNPAQKYVDVQFYSESNDNAQLSVFDAMGKLVISKTLGADDKTNVQLDISELPGGNYFLKIQEPHAVEYKQFIKG